MARNESLLQKALSLVKPEFKAELEKIMKELAAKWDSLSDDQHEDYYWGDGTIGFIFNDNEDLWKALPNLEEIVANRNKEDELGDCILDYICPFDGGKAEDEDASDDAFNQSWEVTNYPKLVITLDADEDSINTLIDQIKASLQLVGIEDYTIDRKD